MSMQDDSPEYEGGTISRVRSAEKSVIKHNKILHQLLRDCLQSRLLADERIKLI